MADIEALIEEVKEAGIKRGENIPLRPIVNMYDTIDHRYFLSFARDYIWFDDNKYK